MIFKLGNSQIWRIKYAAACAKYFCICSNVRVCRRMCDMARKDSTLGPQNIGNPDEVSNDLPGRAKSVARSLKRLEYKSKSGEDYLMLLRLIGGLGLIFMIVALFLIISRHTDSLLSMTKPLTSASFHSIGKEQPRRSTARRPATSTIERTSCRSNRAARRAPISCWAG